MTNEITTPVEDQPGFDLGYVAITPNASMETPYSNVMGKTVWFRHTDDGMAEVIVIHHDGDWNGLIRIIPAALVTFVAA